MIYFHIHTQAFPFDRLQSTEAHFTSNVSLHILSTLAVYLEHKKKGLQIRMKLAEVDEKIDKKTTQ